WAVLLGIGVAAAAAGVHAATSFNPMLLVALAAGAPYLPFAELRRAAKDRFKAIDRALPDAIDLAAMCMGARLDFPGALRQIVDNLPQNGSPMRDELERILQELSLGRTRKQALEGFAQRVPSDAVVEF